MRKLRPFVLALVALAAAVASGAATPEKTPKPKSHGYSVNGTVELVDAKSFVVRSSAGKSTTLVRTTATKVNGDALKTGDRVAVRYLERDGKKVATSIRVEPPSVATATATPTATAPASR
jgi:ATP-dependent 26S proteasome regulatory subunit